MIIRTQKAVKNHQIHFAHVWYTLLCLDCGTGSKSLICTATESCLNTDGGVSFIHASLVFRERLPVCVNAAYSYTEVCWSVNFSVWSLPLHKIRFYGHFQHAMYAHFFVAANVTESFSESLHFVSLGLCSGSTDSRLRTPDEDFSSRTSQAPL